jgi:hypothetical protein
MPIKPTTPPTEYLPDVAEMTYSQRENDHPLGPVVDIVCLDHPLWGRVYATGLLAATVALVVVACSLKPDGNHMGTHQQLGLPPCGFVAVTGYPCPTCGMTTAFAHATRGQLGAALYAQPAGAVLAMGTLLLMVLSLLAAITGRRPSLNWYRINPVRLVWGGALFLVLSWGFKALVGVIDGTLPVDHPF